MIVEMRELSAEELEDFDIPCSLHRFGTRCDEVAKYYALVHVKKNMWGDECESRWVYIGERCYKDLTEGVHKSCQGCGVDGLQSNVMGI